MNSQIVVYDQGDVELKVSMENDTIWLTQKQISLLFEKDLRTINDHIKNIYKNKELSEETTIRKFRIVQKEGKREVSREVLHYNLDMVISIGYRVNSVKATQFRKWATFILKQYISNGSVIHNDKVDNKKLSELEQNISILENRLKRLEDRSRLIQLEDKHRKLSHDVLYDGEMCNAYEVVNDLVEEAKLGTIIFDNCFDEII